MTARGGADAIQAASSLGGWDRLVVPADVDFAYALVLGRPPESEQARHGWNNAAPSIAELLQALMASAEFTTEVAAQLAAEASFSSPRFLEPLTPTGRAWAASVFAADAVLASRTWLELLIRLANAGVFDAPGLLQALAPLLARSAAGGPGSLAIGAALEVVDADKIIGWALDLGDPDRPARLELWAEARFVCAFTPDRFRRDLQDRYGGPGRYGFEVSLPEAAAPDRRRLVELRTPAGRTLSRRHAEPEGAPALDAASAIRDELRALRAALARIEAALPEVRRRTSFTLANYAQYARTFDLASANTVIELSYRPTVAVRVAATGVAADDLRAAMRSAEAQSYPAAEITTVGAHGDAATAADHVLFMGGDVVLEPGAVLAFVRALQGDPRPGLLYGDDDAREAGRAGAGAAPCDPRFKPPLDRHLLLQENYIGQVYLADAALVRRVAGEARGDHERLLALAAALGPHGVRNLPQVLHHRRPGGACAVSDAAAVRAHLRSAGVQAVVEPHADIVAPPRPNALRIRGCGLEGASATVVISTRDRRDLLAPCVESLLRAQAHNAVTMDLLVVDNGGVKPDAAAYLQALSQREGVRVVRDPSPFNWAAINTRAAGQAAGEVLIFLNDDMEVISPDWCDELCFWALQPQVGVVGARLLYGDGAVQHAGVVMGRGGSARHEGVGEPGSEGGYLGRRQLVHAASAVTGACLATRADVFRRLDGFDGARFAVAFNDIDYCLRAGEAGLDVVYTPHATLHHHESASRGFGDAADPVATARAHAELAAFQARHAPALVHDRWMNPHFEREAPAFTRLAPPADS